MMARTASAVPSAAMSHVVVGRCGVWGWWSVAGGMWQKSGRTGRQDKSRDVRLGRSGCWRFDFSNFHRQSTMCDTGPRCAGKRRHLVFLGRAHLAPGHERERRRHPHPPGSSPLARPREQQALRQPGASGCREVRRRRAPDFVVIKASSFGRGRAASLRAGRGLHVRTRLVTVKARVVRHGPKAAPLATHLAYLQRDGVTKDGSAVRMFGAEGGGRRWPRIPRPMRGRPPPLPLHRLA